MIDNRYIIWMKVILVFLALSLAAAAPSGDKMGIPPVLPILFRDTLLLTTPAYTRDILTSKILIVPFTTSSLSPSTVLITKTQSLYGSTEALAAVPS